MASLEQKQDGAHRSAVNKILGSELRKLYDPVVTSRLPERMKELLQRHAECLEQRRAKKKWW